MITADQARAEAISNKTALVVDKNKQLLECLNSLIKEAVAHGEFEITGVFIGHKVKQGVAQYLTDQGYTVKELTTGNTFSISWFLTSKK